MAEVSQLQRSRARKWLSSSCAESIRQILKQSTNPGHSEKKMKKEYISITNITISSLVSLFAIRNQNIDIEQFEKEEIQPVSYTHLTLPTNREV